MCGAIHGDSWETRPARSCIISLQPKFGDAPHLWNICDECQNGLKGLGSRLTNSGRSFSS